jgi:hypothetical protein
MTAAPIKSSRPDHWTHPRPTPDPRKRGPLLPMETPRRGWKQRIRAALTRTGGRDHD